MVDPEFGEYPWAFAPDGYEWAAMDFRSPGSVTCYWHRLKPSIREDLGWWCNTEDKGETIEMGDAPANWPRDRWRESLRARPE